MIVGSDMANTLNGGNGSDMIDGGMGGDRLIGGKGNDVFVFNAINDTTNVGLLVRGDGSVKSPKVAPDLILDFQMATGSS